jgi:uncharacterized protein YhaN
MNQQLCIETLRLDGFGRFGGVEIKLNSGLTVLFGSNEAGKSTLAAFVKGVLFGFGKRGAVGRYQPPHGAHGGEVEFTTRGQRLIVRRIVKPKILEGELSVMGAYREPLSPRALSEALGHVSEALFSQVFSFSLDQLRAFSALTQESSVAEHLFAAGTQGAQRLPQALATLAERAEGVFGPKAKTRPLNTKVERLLSVRTRLAALELSPEAFLATRALVRQLHVEVAAARVALEASQDERERLLVLTRATQHRLRLAHATIPLVPLRWSKAPALLGRACQIEAALAASREAYQRATEAAAEVAARRSRCVLPSVQAVGHALSQVTALTTADSLSGLSKPHIDAAISAVERDLSLVWPNETPAERWVRLEGLDVGPRAIGTLEAVAAQRAEARRRHQSLADEAAVGQSSLAAAQEAASQSAQATAAMVQLAPGQRLGVESPIDEKDVCVADLWPLWQALPAAEAEQSRAQALCARRAADVESVVLPSKVTVWPLLLLAGFFLVAAIVGGWLLVTSAALVFVSLSLVAVVASLGASLVRLLHGTRARAAHQVELERLRTAYREAQRDEASARAHTGRLRAEGRLAETVDVGRVMASAAAWREAATEVSEAERAMQRHRVRLAESSQQAEGRAAVWHECLGRLGLGADEGVETVRALAELQGRWALLRGQREVKAKTDALLQSATAHLSMALREANAADIQPDAGEVNAWLTEMEAQKTEAERLEVSHAAHLAAAKQHSASIEASSEALRACWAEAGVSSNAELEAAASAVNDRALALSEAEAAAQAFSAAMGCEVAKAVQLHDSVPDAEAALNQIDSSLHLLRPHTEGLLAQLGAAEQRLLRLSHDEERAALRAEESTLTADIDRLAEQAAIALAARALLQGVRAQAEGEQQPKLVRRAGAHFARLTGGAYPHVSVEPGGKAVKVHESSGASWPVEALSRGTREMLLFSFHIAMAQEVAESRVALPLVLDDVFVNLDAERLTRVADLLAQLSTRHQVIVLTCHSAFSSLLTARGAGLVQVAPPRQLSLLPS